MSTTGKGLLFAVVLFAVPLSAAREPQITRAPIGPGVVLEKEGQRRRVVVTSTVVLRKGVLEGLLTRAKKKEHEYVLAADVDARHVHAALLAAGAAPGGPVRFQPKFAPAHGTAIRVHLRYEQGGKKRTVAAKDWLRAGKGAKPLTADWVFAGSRFGPNPEGEDKPPYYMANHGDLICLCNMETALLDLPVRSPKAINDRLYEAHTERIPPAGTRVEVILEPLPPAKGR